MHIKFTSEYNYEPRVGDFTPEVLAFLKEYPEIENKRTATYSTELFDSKEKVSLVVQTAAALKYANTEFMDKKILQNLFKNIQDYCQKIENPIPLLEAFATETARIVEASPVTTMSNQAFGILKELKTLEALKDFSVVINERNYNYTERNYKNSEAGRNGLSVFL